MSNSYISSSKIVKSQFLQFPVFLIGAPCLISLWRLRHRCGNSVRHQRVTAINDTTRRAALVQGISHEFPDPNGHRTLREFKSNSLTSGNILKCGVRTSGNLGQGIFDLKQWKLALGSLRESIASLSPHGGLEEVENYH